MHQECVFENKEQYNKSNAVLTGVIRDAFNNGVIDEFLKNAIEKFQVKLATIHCLLHPKEHPQFI
jgi:hypothetical protein